MTTANHNRDMQFSLRTLLAIITVACMILAIPGGYVLLETGTAWMLLGAAIVWVLMIFRSPLDRFLSGAKPKEEGP